MHYGELTETNGRENSLEPRDPKRIGTGKAAALLVSFSERFPFYQDTNKGRIQSQGLPVGVRFTKVCVKRDCTVMWPRD